MDDEVQLSSDGLTHVVRVGETVRRPWRDYTPTVHAYLEHLWGAGITFVPKPLGKDDREREVLSFVPGDIPMPPLPSWATDDQALVEIAGLIRQLHDAADGWEPPAEAVWGTLPGAIVRGESIDDSPTLVSHSDYCPGNVVFREQRPAAFIASISPDQRRE